MKFPDETALLAAIPKRHSVRHYREDRVPMEIIEALNEEVDRINARYGYSFRVVTDEPNSFRNIFAYGKFRNSRNYIIISAPKGKLESLLCGYEGERLVLGLQAMGLNTCWVGLSYSKNSDVFKVPDGHRIRCVISFGYGDTSGVERKSKSIEKLSDIGPDSPDWFREGMQNVMLAPTAINQQKFYFSLRPDGVVEGRSLFSLVGYTDIDFGIAILHFQLAAQHKVLLPSAYGIESIE